MIIVLKKAAQEDINRFIKEIERENDVSVNIWQGTDKTVLGLIGDTLSVDERKIGANKIVESVKRIAEPYKKANRKFHNDDSVFNIAGRQIGGGTMTLMAGPCSVESEEQICGIAERIKKAGAAFLRGGAFKPRTSPYSFQGLRGEGIQLLLKAKKYADIPIVTEIMAMSDFDLFADVDIIQVGARNMQNFEMLKALGHTDKPILLKRGLANTIEETLMSAEYIMAGGNDKVILCERGIRTFETATRNTLDISAVPVLKERTHLPIIVDPSHAAGFAKLIRPLSMAAVAAGVDGLMIEVHNDPANALSDGQQSITPDEFDSISSEVFALHDFMQSIK